MTDLVSPEDLARPLYSPPTPHEPMPYISATLQRLASSTDDTESGARAAALAVATLYEHRLWEGDGAEPIILKEVAALLGISLVTAERALVAAASQDLIVRVDVTHRGPVAWIPHA